ncbi:TIR domain-containing protein [Streptomyces fuscigenes]|uniref:TIR domain-containing protein n=1 Tax=Streptomyces fuscigenes TaxID=1528880 RepID=UPI001F27F1C9|nr:TIR domain-containing protein [Streptomyces fuscigenes]MCF3960801.1 TIR domain-containing protein [Streptomyces fuscigenes]
MSLVRVEDVFKISGVPTHTFVKPSEYNRLKVALRSPGRGVIVEGPSGIGKSTAVIKALRDNQMNEEVVQLSARSPSDVEYIELLHELGKFGTVVIDDFHRLQDSVKSQISDLLKIMADTEDPHRKIVIIGINEAGRSLIKASPDLSNRIDVVRFEVEPDSKIEELVTSGEAALNVSFGARDLIVEKSKGSFYLAQLLCMEACVLAEILEKPEERTQVGTSFSAIQRRVVSRQRDRFGGVIRSFARGTKFRPSGRAPYLHILRWLSESESWSISILDEMRKHPSEKASVGLVSERGYLENLTNSDGISEILHFDSDTGILSVENPMLIFYLRNISWADFIREVGFTKVDYEESYDFALSFAGEDRAFAESLRDALEDLGHTVFYDMAEQHRFLGQDVETYMGPIYASGSRFVIAVLGEMYGTKRWPLFEVGMYTSRFADGEVIPIWSSKIPPSATDPVRGLGYLTFAPDGNAVSQATEHAAVLTKMLKDRQ